VKTCRVCAENKPLSDYRRGGRCKKCDTAATAAWQLANPEKTRAQADRWRERHGKRYAREYYWKTRDSRRTLRQAAWQRRKARLLNAKGDATPEAIAARFAYYGNCCAYCGWPEDLSIEHVIPLSRGGTNWPANRRPACGLCNRSKGARLLSEWSPRWATVTYEVPQDESWRGFYDREADAA
jgi:5-methylcytosine-specific restriction endonuclease McrA